MMDDIRWSQAEDGILVGYVNGIRVYEVTPTREGTLYLDNILYDANTWVGPECMDLESVMFFINHPMISFTKH